VSFFRQLAEQSSRYRVWIAIAEVASLLSVRVPDLHQMAADTVLPSTFLPFTEVLMAFQLGSCIARSVPW
jgi:hypothetical protein